MVISIYFACHIIDNYKLKFTSVAVRIGKHFRNIWHTRTRVTWVALEIYQVGVRVAHLGLRAALEMSYGEIIQMLQGLTVGTQWASKLRQ